MVIFFSKKRVDFNWIDFFKEKGGEVLFIYMSSRWNLRGCLRGMFLFNWVEPVFLLEYG